jgi:hypothetical protein
MSTVKQQLQIADALFYLYFWKIRNEINLFLL